MTEDWKVRMVELKRCPFCGGKATIDGKWLNGWFAGCFNAQCQVQPETGEFDSPSKAIEAWNRRV